MAIEVVVVVGVRFFLGGGGGAREREVNIEHAENGAPPE